MEIRSRLGKKELIQLWREMGGTFPLQRIMRLATAAGCRTVILQRDPPEKEYAREYAEFYKDVQATLTKSTPTRLHFFEGELALDEIADYDSRYLGYCDVRPTPDRSLSCALIDERLFAPSGSGKHLYLICKRDFTVPFGLKTLKVKAFPYIQQDGAIITCAQAALANIAMYLGKEMTGPDFTLIASKVPTDRRPIPSPGLSIEQVALGISHMGLDPLVYDWSRMPKGLEEIEHREQIIYRYLESGIPVFVGIKTNEAKHALVVIGHTFTPDTWQTGRRVGQSVVRQVLQQRGFL